MRTLPDSPHWITASFGHSPNASAPELLALGDHLRLCWLVRSPWRRLQDGARGLHGLAASRLVSTLFMASVLGAALLLWLNG